MKNQFKKDDLFLADGMAIKLLENVVDGQFVRVCFEQTVVATWINSANRTDWVRVTQADADAMPTMDVQHDAA